MKPTTILKIKEGLEMLRYLEKLVRCVKRGSHHQ
jgi:hypothetical protein